MTSQFKEERKVCSKCQEKKPVALFHKDKSRRCGLTCYCKQCVQKKLHQYYVSNREIILGKNKTWRANNKDYLSSYFKQYALNNKRSRNAIRQSYKKRRKEKFPWIYSFVGARDRCTRKSCFCYMRYGARGIKFLMTLSQVGELWIRDKAFLMTRPVLHRINNDGDYSLRNCRFLENSEHTSYHLRRRRK